MPRSGHGIRRPIRAGAGEPASRAHPRTHRSLRGAGYLDPVLIRCLKLRVVGVSSPTKPRETASPPGAANRAPSPKTWFRSRAQPPCLRPPRLPSRRHERSPARSKSSQMPVTSPTSHLMHSGPVLSSVRNTALQSMSQIPMPPAHRITINACPRCGQPKTVPATGRPPIWCSQRCRRAAYEERRAAARGAIAIQLIDSGSGHHDIGECAMRAQDSPAACRLPTDHRHAHQPRHRTRTPVRPEVAVDSESYRASGRGPGSASPTTMTLAAPVLPTASLRPESREESTSWAGGR